MSYKGIVLAGGSGQRLSPLTKILNKHLLPIHDKPMIFYALSILFLSKIKDILVICRKQDIKSFQNLLGDGTRFGVNFEYAVQEKPTAVQVQQLVNSGINSKQLNKINNHIINSSKINTINNKNR